MSRTVSSKTSHTKTRAIRVRKASRGRITKAPEDGNEARSSWYSGPTSKRKLETFCTEAFQTGKPVDLFGHADNPLLQIRRDIRKAKGPLEFDIPVEWAMSEWVAIANAATLGVTFRVKIARNKYVILTQHPKLQLNEYEEMHAKQNLRERDAAIVAQQETAIKTLSDIATQFAFISDKLDARADLIQRRFMEAWRRANVPGNTAQTG